MLVFCERVVLWFPVNRRVEDEKQRHQQQQQQQLTLSGSSSVSTSDALTDVHRDLATVTHLSCRQHRAFCNKSIRLNCFVCLIVVKM